MTMTIREFNEQHESVETAHTAIADAEKQLQTICKAMAELTKAMPKLTEKQKEQQNNINNSLYVIEMAHKQALARLKDYERLLRDIAGATKITWPPVCEEKRSQS